MIYIYSPPNTKCYFIQVMKAIEYELNNLKCQCKIIDKLQLPKIERTKKNFLILFGFHDICSIEQVKKYIKQFTTIVYNSEQLHLNHLKYYINCLKNIDYIWDYSINNINYLKELSITNTVHIPLGYSKSFVIDNNNNINNDNLRDNTKIIFIGNMNLRRYNIIRKIDSLNQDVIFFDKLWGNEHDKCIKNNTLFLNIHYYPKPILELFRIIPLICNKCAVISEYSSDTELDKMYSSYISFFKEDLSDFIKAKEISLSEGITRYNNFSNEMSFSKIINSSGVLKYIKNI